MKFVSDVDLASILLHNSRMYSTVVGKVEKMRRDGRTERQTIPGSDKKVRKCSPPMAHLFLHTHAQTNHGATAVHRDRYSSSYSSKMIQNLKGRIQMRAVQALVSALLRADLAKRILYYVY